MSITNSGDRSSEGIYKKRFSLDQIRLGLLQTYPLNPLPPLVPPTGGETGGDF